MADARKFIFNSDFPTPYLAYNSGTLSITAKKADNYGSVITTAKVKHDSPFIPLLVGYWSTDPNFTLTHDITCGYVEYSQTPLFDQYFKYRADFAADENYIYITVENFTSSDATIYFRLAGFIPPDYNGVVSPIPDSSDFILNSDFNYNAIVMAGVKNYSDNFDVTVTHNLGYAPQCRTWEERLWYDDQGVQTAVVIGPVLINDGISKYSDGTYYFAQPVVDETKLYFQSNNYDSLRFFYHIYGDEI